MATPPSYIYTLSLHDALPIFRSRCHDRPCPDRILSVGVAVRVVAERRRGRARAHAGAGRGEDRKSTRLNSSHRCISYAVFCLKKNTKHNLEETLRRYLINPTD